MVPIPAAMRVCRADAFDAWAASLDDARRQSATPACRLRRVRFFYRACTPTTHGVDGRTDAVACIGEFVGGVRDGVLESFNDAHRLVARAHYTDGMRHGDAVRWWDADRGLVRAFVRYVYDCKVGIETHFYANGMLRQQAQHGGDGGAAGGARWFKSWHAATGALVAHERYDDDATPGTDSDADDTSDTDCDSASPQSPVRHCRR
jgi:hypothetical protein